MQSTGRPEGARQLTWLLAWAVVFCDIGTSVYYVPGILYLFVGDLAPFFVLMTAAGFILLAVKYVEVVDRTPGGGGVVAIASMAFGERLGALGGMLIIVDFFLTCSISSVSGFYYLSSVIPPIADRVPLFACLGLIFLAIVNIVGVRESARLSFVMAAASLITNLAIVVLLLVSLDVHQWGELFRFVEHASELSVREVLIGFGAAWLAFSGLESISQLAPVMRKPLRKTAAMAMGGVVVTVLLTSPTLTVLSIGLLPGGVKAEHSERFISELAQIAGGGMLEVAVVLTAASLLLFAANTAIIGCYHVFIALAERKYFPRRFLVRNRQFGTPHNAILFATVVPLAVIMATQGEMGVLGDMYAFGLLGAFVLESGGLDALRWRGGRRGVAFAFGLIATAMVIVAWLVNLVVKPAATAFGGSLAAIGMLYGLALREGWIKEALHQIPAVSRRDLKKSLEGEIQATELVHEIVTLDMAKQLKPLYSSSTLVAVAGRNPHVLAEGIRRVKGMGDKAVYCVYVEEWPGLFYDASEGLVPSDAGVDALMMAAKQAAGAGLELIPIWTISYSLVEGISRAARELGVNGIVIGLSQRTALYRLFRREAIRKLARRVPEECRLIICD